MIGIFGEDFAQVRKIFHSMYIKTFTTFFLAFLITISGQAQQLINDKIDVLAGNGVDNRNAVLYFPKNYSEDKKYPLVIFTHGMGEAGTDINKLYRTGLPRVLKKGYRPSFDFIMVAPQSRSFSASAHWLPGILESAIKRWNIDTNRIYLTGLSAGGKSIYGSQLSLNPAIAAKFAAIVTNAGVVPASSVTNYGFWKVSKTPLWAVVGSNDKSYVSKNARLVDNVNKQVPGIASLTLQKGVGHSGWDNVYNGKVKNGTKTMWEWMYQFNRASENFPFPDGNDNNNDDNDDDDDNDDNNDDDDDDDDDNPPPTGPKMIQVKVYAGSNSYTNTQWNNWNVGSKNKTNITSEPFNYADATVSTVKANLSESYAVVDNSATYGGGMAPAQVLRHSSYAMKERTLVISGLNPDKKYNFEFYASRIRKNNKTVFAILGQSKIINTYYNFTNKAEFKQIVPDSSGKVTITINNLNQYNYLNGFTIIEDAEDNGDDDDNNDDDDDDDGDDDDGDDN